MPDLDAQFIALSEALYENVLGRMSSHERARYQALIDEGIKTGGPPQNNDVGEMFDAYLTPEERTQYRTILDAILDKVRRKPKVSWLDRLLASKYVPSSTREAFKVGLRNGVLWIAVGAFLHVCIDPPFLRFLSPWVFLQVLGVSVCCSGLLFALFLLEETWRARLIVAGGSAALFLGTAIYIVFDIAFANKLFAAETWGPGSPTTPSWLLGFVALGVMLVLLLLGLWMFYATKHTVLTTIDNMPRHYERWQILKRFFVWMGWMKPPPEIIPEQRVRPSNQQEIDDLRID